MVLKHIFYVPSFTPGPILLKMSGLKSVASKIAIKKLVFLGHLITEPTMAPTVRNLFQCRAESYFDTNVTSAGVLLSISEVLVKYDLFHHFESWHNSSTIPSYENWKRIVTDRIRVFENDAWLQFCDNHPDIHIIQTCFENISPPDFWSLADEYPDLVTRLHTQARLMGGFDLNGSVPWLKDMEGALCFICKEDVENTYHFFFWIALSLKRILTLFGVTTKSYEIKPDRWHSNSQLYQEPNSLKYCNVISGWSFPTI